MKIKLIPRVKERRMEAHLNQKELADSLGIAQSQMSHIEKGNYAPSLKVAFTIAKTLQCKVDDLFEIEEEE